MPHQIEGNVQLTQALRELVGDEALLAGKARGLLEALAMPPQHLGDGAEGITVQREARIREAMLSRESGIVGGAW